MTRKQIVLLGIGHTNAHVVKQWATDPILDCSLVCISKFPSATYSGMLPGTLARQFRDDEMRIDLTELAKRCGAEMILADTTGIDLEQGTIHFSDHPNVRFDAMSIGVGSMPAGWQDHDDNASVVPVKPMQTFIARINDRLETVVNRRDAERNGKSVEVAIVGGGVSSVEIAFCLLQQCKERKIQDKISVKIFTSGDSVAGGMKPRSVRRIKRLLKSQSIQVVAGQRVGYVREDHLVTDDENQHRADCVIWATGAAAPPVLGRLGLKTDQRGFIATKKSLQSLSDPRIFAVGDSGTVIESPSPKAGVYAVRQCPILWHNLRSLLQGGEMKSFHPQSDFLKLLNTGDGKALLEYGPLTTHARWCWRLKTWIDKRFVSEFQVQKAS